jgi:hypothetical protein
VTNSMIQVYLGLAVAAAVGLLAAQGRRASDEGIPPKQAAGLCALSGALWPVLLIGLAQLWAVAACARGLRARR